TLAKVARIVDAAIAGGVDLHHVERGLAGPDPAARLALTARLAILAAIGAVEGHGEDSRSGGLPHPARAREQVAVADPTTLNRAPQGSGNVILDQEICETARTIAPGECDRHRGSCGGGKCKCRRLPEETPSIA